DPEQRPAARARILLAGSERTPPQLGRWYVTSAGNVLDQVEPGQLASSAGLSQLIYACLRVAREFPVDSIRRQLEKWLRSAPPLAENAALALRAINPDWEREAVETAISDSETPELTRTFLAGHLRRLDP
ncbi:MAG: hypothetical protein R3212_08610, partial [Xanthomonadales bacterium]|nr:hypothetical protein [Xanthomonadales bacterium]